MDPGEVTDDQPRRRRRRRRRIREEDEPRVERLGFGVIARQLAGLGVFGLFFLLVIAAPIPMGGNRDWAWSPMVIAIGVLALLCALGVGGREGLKVSAEESTPLLVLVVCFLVFVAVVVLQMSSFAPAAPSAALYDRAGAIIHETVTTVPTLAVDTTRDALLKCLGCAAIFMIARVLFHDPQWGRLLLLVFCLSAAVVVTYGIYMSVTTHSCYVGSYLKKEGGYSFATDRCLMSGTFVGSNNFGCFAGMALVAALALLFASPSSRRAQEELEYGGESNPFAEWFSARRVMSAALSLYFLGGLLLSASRAGTAATALGIVALGGLLLRGRSRKVMRRTMIGGAAVGVLILVIAGGALLHKSSALFNAGNLNRVVIWRTSLVAFAQSPWVGWGLGTYNDVYAMHQPPTITQPNDKAHSTPLEFLVEVGLIGGLPAMAACAIPWGVCFLGGLRGRRQRLLPAAAFAIAAVAILHSTIDFSLQMPAIGFIVSAFLGLGWAQAFSPTERPQRTFATEP
jgi:O-Antigen ligase